MAKNAPQAKAKIDLYPTEPIKFWAPVTIPTAEGKSLEISFLFRHRTRKEQAKLAEDRIDRARAAFEEAQARDAADKAKREADAKMAAENDEAPPVPMFPPTPKLVDQVLDEMEQTVDGLMEIAEDWNIEGHAFTAEHLTQLCNLHGAAASAISTEYRDALAKGRLGN